MYRAKHLHLLHNVGWRIRSAWWLTMWFFLISNIAGSILGSAANSWFADTKLGIWFYKKVDDVSTWASKKLGLKVLQDENTWRKKYPNVSKKLDVLEARLEKLEKEK
jgi:hypothetical protein